MHAHKKGRKYVHVYPCPRFERQGSDDIRPSFDLQERSHVSQIAQSKQSRSKKKKKKRNRKEKKTENKRN